MARPRAKRAAPRRVAKAKARPRTALVAAGVGAVAVVVAIAGLAYAVSASGGHGTGKAVVVRLGPRAPGELADALAEKGIIASGWRFATYARLFCEPGDVAEGEHLLRDDLGPRDLCRAMERKDGRDKAKLTVPEGFTRFDIARRLEDKRIAPSHAFLEATVDAALLREINVPAPSAEGYLFPATYSFPENTPARDVVRRLRAEHESRLAKLRAAVPDSPHARELSWTMHDLVTLASMIEKEAVVDDERPIVASVFVNRFRDPGFTPKPPKLQSDPTSAYGCLVSPQTIPACAGFTGKITPELNHDPHNVWSTYVTVGLPPGPVCNPGEKSLAAALAPADTRYLYFVAKGAGRHAFSATLAEHNAAVQQQRK